MTDSQAALAQVREALEAGPTPGPWVTMPANAGVHCVARINAWETVPPTDCELSHDSIDASFIAACSPANMSAILAHVDAQAAALVAAEAALADIGDADREPGDDIKWAERRAMQALPIVRNALLEIDPRHPIDGIEARDATIRAQDKEIERLTAALQYEQHRAGRQGTHGDGCADWGPAHYECAIRERDDLRRQLAEARAEREAMANVLPGVYYMDPPDGGDVSLLKQLQRMSNDAARYRLLRRKFAIISDGEGNAEFCPINLPRPAYIAPNTAIELDTALDRERLGLDGAKRPPTPVGWSDTDWIKHLQEQAEQPHPLAGQHINQGSMDAAADAYEAEYNAARGISEADKD